MFRIAYEYLSSSSSSSLPEDHSLQGGGGHVGGAGFSGRGARQHGAKTVFADDPADDPMATGEGTEGNPEGGEGGPKPELGALADATDEWGGPAMQEVG